MENNIENHKHINTPLTVENEIKIMTMVGFDEISSTDVDKDDYSLLKARRRQF